MRQKHKRGLLLESGVLPFLEAELREHHVMVLTASEGQSTPVPETGSHRFQALLHSKLHWDPVLET